MRIEHGNRAYNLFVAASEKEVLHTPGVKHGQQEIIYAQDSRSSTFALGEPMFIPADCQELRHRQKHRGGLYKPCSKGPPGLPWPLPPELDDTALEILLFPSSATVPLALEKHHYPSLEELHRELARPNMTLKLL